jgi:probable addiction module antidote protein
MRRFAMRLRADREMTKKSTKLTTSRLAPAKSRRRRPNATKVLSTALEAGGAGPFLDALRDMVRAKGTARMAKRAGVSRKDLAAAFSKDGKAKFGEVLRVFQTAGMKLSVKARAA